MYRISFLNKAVKTIEAIILCCFQLKNKIEVGIIKNIFRFK